MTHFLIIEGDNASRSEALSHNEALRALGLYQKEVKAQGYVYEGSTGNYVKPVPNEDCETWTHAYVVDAEGKGEDRTCSQCGKWCPPSKYDFTPGYGRDKDGKIVCYECCAKWDRLTMISEGKHFLYLSKGDDGYHVTNWPGSLTFPVPYVRKGFHNMARCRYDFWFVGPDGHRWHGVQYGDNTQIAHVKRTKEVVQRHGA